MKPEVLDLLTQNNIRIFKDRLITDAQPAITEEQIEEIEKHLSGPVPDDLKNLWRLSFGGALDYDLRVNYDGHIHPFSFCELFYPESPHYKDFWGWLEHEKELAQESALERGETFSGKLDYLPFGGFEYLERLYVIVRPGKDYGAVLAWSQGLPPAWTMRLHEDSIASIAPNLSSLFSNLCYETDPFHNSEYIFTGEKNLELLEQIKTLPEFGIDAAQFIEKLMRSAIIDRDQTHDKATNTDDTFTAALVIEDAIGSKSWPALKKLFDAGYDIHTPLKGGGNILDYAMSRGALEIAQNLLNLGVTSEKALINGAAWVTPEMAKTFLALGNKVSVDEVITALHFNDQSYEVARLFAESLLANQLITFSELKVFIDDRINGYEISAKRIEAGDFVSNISAEQNRVYANSLREIVASLKDL